MAPWWWFPCKPKHVGAASLILIVKWFNNSTFFNVVCVSWTVNCWRFSLLHKPSRPAAVSTLPPIQWLPVLYPKAARSYIDHFPLSSVEIKEWSWTPDPAVLLHGVDSNDFILFCTGSAYFNTFCFEQNQAKKEYAAGLSSAAVFSNSFPQLLGPKSWVPNCSLFRRSKVVPVHAVRAYCWNGGTAPLIHNLGTRWRWVVSFTSGKGGSESSSGCQNNVSSSTQVPKGIEWYLYPARSGTVLGPWTRWGTRRRNCRQACKRRFCSEVYWIWAVLRGVSRQNIKRER